VVLAMRLGDANVLMASELTQIIRAKAKEKYRVSLQRLLMHRNATAIIAVAKRHAKPLPMRMSRKRIVIV